MADGHCQVYGYCIVAFDYIFRNARPHHHLFVVILSSIVLGFGLYWVNKGEQEIENKKKKK